MAKRAPGIGDLLEFLAKAAKVGSQLRDDLERLREGVEEEARGDEAPPPEVARALAWLGLDPDEKVSREEVLAAYRETASRYHPDKGGSDRRMRRTNEAKEILLAWLAEAA